MLLSSIDKMCIPIEVIAKKDENNRVSVIFMDMFDCHGLMGVFPIEATKP
jgi:hypothetical protein